MYSYLIWLLPTMYGPIATMTRQKWRRRTSEMKRWWVLLWRRPIAKWNNRNNDHNRINEIISSSHFRRELPVCMWICGLWTGARHLLINVWTICGIHIGAYRIWMGQFYCLQSNTNTHNRQGRTASQVRRAPHIVHLKPFRPQINITHFTYLFKLYVCRDIPLFVQRSLRELGCARARSQTRTHTTHICIYWQIWKKTW